MRILKQRPDHWTSPRKDYFLKLWEATPDWLTREQVAEIRAIYREAARLRAQGYDVQVHHKTPLNGEYVSGLHVPWNLEIVDTVINLSLSNHYWPDMPNEPAALALDQPPQQLSLCI